MIVCMTSHGDSNIGRVYRISNLHAGRAGPVRPTVGPTSKLRRQDEQPEVTVSQNETDGTIRGLSDETREEGGRGREGGRIG